MSDDEYERIAQALQAIPYPKGPHRNPPAWSMLVESSRDYWRAKARAGERPKPATDTPSPAASSVRAR